MKILLEFTTINYRMWHSMAKRLKELFPEASFAGIVGVNPGKESILDFLREQRDIEYKFLVNFHDIYAKALDHPIDRESLKKFEQTFPHKSLWRVMAADRELGFAFIHDAEWRRSFINQNSSYETNLKIFSGLLKQISQIFSDFKPDLFLPAIAMGNISVFIYEQLCKEYKIPYIVPSNVRVKSYFAFSADSQLRFPQIDQTYGEFYKQYTPGKFPEAEKLYELIISELENPQYFDRINNRFNIASYEGIKGKARWLVLLVKKLGREVVNWQKTAAIRRSNSLWRQPDKLSTFMHNLAYAYRFSRQKLVLTDPNFYHAFDRQQKYIYYPLHITPEYSTQVQGTMWVDQLFNIELLSKSIPFDWQVYVKEHPGTLVARTRPLSFYKRIKELPNVRLIPIDADMHEVIMHAQMVAVVTGTSGWEGVLRGKPVICFADNMWDALGLSIKCSDVEKIASDIDAELRRQQSISKEERRKRIICLLAAILHHSFEISYPNQFVYTEMGTDEQYEVVGKETADALKKHLEYLKQGKKVEFQFV